MRKLLSLIAFIELCACTPKQDANGFIHLHDQTSAGSTIVSPFKPCSPNYIRGCGGALVNFSVIEAHARSGTIIWE